MSETSGPSQSDDSQACLHDVLRTCANIPSLESVFQPIDFDYNDVYLPSCSASKMISPNPYSVSGNISNSSFASEDSFTDNILEDNGRISLAYENLRTIPRRIAEKFAAQTKCLDLSHNNFQNLAFLSFFEDLHTLILDRNVKLDVNTLPYLPSLTILWLNNCDISNITDWIHRIERQCPALEHLSLMGNPGIRTVFRFNHSSSAMDCHYREYILSVLPNLKYLDGLASGASADSQCLGVALSSRESMTSNSASPTLSFKQLFRRHQRHRSCTGDGMGSSSTN